MGITWKNEVSNGVLKSVISVLFLCVLYSMCFAILYGMFNVDRNLVLFSTELI